VAQKYNLDAEEARNWRLAKIFDLRSFIGSLFVIFGALVLISGLTASQEDIEKAAGINIAVWVGGLMLALAVIFIVWLLIKPPPPITKAEMEAHRKELEDLGTHGGVHH
jgi:NADH:ubiquinone oxidoreductase subunit 6 (subunit J)